MVPAAAGRDSGSAAGVALVGNHAAFAIPERRVGTVSPDFRMDRMVLLLKPDAGRQRALDALAAAQQDRGSPLYHRWLTPEEYADAFGASAEETARIAQWLSAEGFRVEEVGASRRTIVFSGTAGQVDAALHAEMGRYEARGGEHVANGADPAVPQEFAGEIAGIAGLHDVRSAPAHVASAEYTAGSQAYLAPADVATIYGIEPLHARGRLGAGTAIAVVARSNPMAADVADFRSSFGLPASAPQVIVNGSDPGTGDAEDLQEAELDAEWAGAVAPAAAVDVVASASTETTDGVLLSAQYAVDHAIAPVIAVSYALCEADMGPAENAVYNALWEQAAVEGMTVVVAGGDSGAANCDDPQETVATGGRAVNGMCSTPYSLCVGGTEFADEGGGYWAQGNAANGGSALGYIPETAWNESSAGGLWAGGGGASTVYARPGWQTGAGGWRETPDVALSSATHDGYLFWLNGEERVVGGTSAAAQVMAGIAALLVDAQGDRLGNVAPAFYAAAAWDPQAFHDVVSGNNSVPGVEGFDAVAGYDEATGLGSVNAAELADALARADAEAGPFACGMGRSCRGVRAGRRPGPVRSP